MAQPATTAKLEELRFKLKTDPKSRLFYQLAEELRKAGHFDESEQVLRSGLIVYPTYLAAWVSLGRTLREQKNDGGAVEALNRALQLDPGNVVAARILADAYLALGEKIEAIKKYKLVHALLPSDEELRLTIERLESDLREPEPEPEPPIEEAAAPAEVAEIVETVEAPIPAAPFEEESPFDRTMPPFAEARSDAATADDEPMLVAHEESPFEEPVNTFTADAFEVEAPSGMHIEEAPLEAEVPLPVFDPEERVAESNGSDAANTATMADLYVRQGLVDDARQIYENILARDPGNGDVRAKLDAITPRTKAKVAALERWLTRVSRREVGSV
ncbi:MAG TPA: tetratricopeptide repeat protein [Thermoanaerobaculia bacterium]|jgi:tetratricopeptide (TPR) repeat protein|nr:tetratricopeptide repeat protein [Thermoanaerobaculia bacterium]